MITKDTSNALPNSKENLGNCQLVVYNCESRLELNVVFSILHNLPQDAKRISQLFVEYQAEENINIANESMSLTLMNETNGKSYNLTENETTFENFVDGMYKLVGVFNLKFIEKFHEILIRKWRMDHNIKAETAKDFVIRIGRNQPFREYWFVKNSLASLSNMFAGMFQIAENDNELYLPLFEEEESIATMCRLLGGRRMYEDDFSIGLYIFSDKYGFCTIFKMISHFFENTIANNNVEETVLAANLTDDDELFKKCAIFMMENGRENDGWKDFRKRNEDVFTKILGHYFEEI